MALFNRNDQQQEVPRVEVQGEDVIINRPDSGPEEEPEERKKLPKTKWF